MTTTTVLNLKRCSSRKLTQKFSAFDPAYLRHSISKHLTNLVMADMCLGFFTYKMQKILFVIISRFCQGKKTLVLIRYKGITDRIFILNQVQREIYERPFHKEDGRGH